MTARFLIGDVFDRMAQLEDGSVDLILTSPPFLALRSYLPAGHPDKAKEIGSEATPAEFLDTLLALTAEWRRLLAPHGSLAVELGDKYSGSGGAGGDYDDGAWRDGQNRFGSIAGRPGWPMEKSLSMIPTLYPACLAYGRNLLTGAESPAGQWRIRNLKPWIRTNPPVGALGDKERPATSYITVATLAWDRWFDLDAVRVTPTRPREGTTRHKVRDDVTPGTLRGSDVGEFEVYNPGGAPPLDWWHQVDALIDNELNERARRPPTHKRNNGQQARSGKSAADERGGNWASLNEVGQLESDAQGARGWHIRRRLETAGYLTTQDALDISPRGYSGAHYAVWPPELCCQLIAEMCPPGGLVLDPFVGSGTTLAVASGMGRDSIGIDLDERNAELALERVGMFLDIDYGSREIPA